MRTEYDVNCGFDSFRLSVDLEEASAPILVNFDPDEEGSMSQTPYQTADARHSLIAAIRLVLEDSQDWCVDPSDPRSTEDQIDSLMDHLEIREV